MALTDKLTAIGSAIREKTGSTDLLTLDAMPDAISNIQTGNTDVTDYIPESVFVLSGNCDYRFYFGHDDWLIEKYGDRITTNNISNAQRMLSASSEPEIPFDINITNADCDFIFGQCKIKTPPYIKGSVSGFSAIFQYCNYLSYIPEDWADYIDFSKFHTSNKSVNNMFFDCYSLRKIPANLMKNLYSASTSYFYAPYYNMFQDCYALDEIKEILVVKNRYEKNNAFYNTFNYCGRAKEITFAMQDNGEPFETEWSTQTLNLSIYTGYLKDNNSILSYNSGITSDKEVTDNSTYQELKDDPDWFTTNVKYSRYNHDSAVETIKSLPDTSAFLNDAGGTNIIKFKGDSGKLTDGGAISTMTDEEIAVATEKGWTVSFV